MRIHAEKVETVRFTPYLSLDGRSAARVDELNVSVAFPIGRHARFQQVLSAMEESFAGEVGIAGQVVQMLTEDLPNAVRRRKLQRFVKGGSGCPLTMSGVFLVDRKCTVSLRMELCNFAIETGDRDLAGVKKSLGLIKRMRDARYEV